MKKIVFTHHLPLDRFTDRLSGYEVVRPAEMLASFSREELMEHVKGATALLCSGDYKCDADVIAAGADLSVIGNMGAGYNNIDVTTATARKIFVLNTPTGVTDSTAELAIALILSITRNIVMYDRELRIARRCKSPLLLDRDMVLVNKTLGVLGFGRIGRSVAKKAIGLGMKIIYSDIQRATPEMEAELNATYMTPDEVMATADVVTVHVPYTKENHHYIDARRIALMKPTAYLVNTARGAIVSESALVDALRNKRIRGAALDVHEYEPEITEDVASLDNIVITPHVGTSLAEVRLNMLAEVLNGVLDTLDGQRPYNIVNSHAR